MKFVYTFPFCVFADKNRGFANIVLIPRRHINKPAIMIELKYNKNISSAIAQIKSKQYPDMLKNYSGKILLVGITSNCSSSIYKALG